MTGLRIATLPCVMTLPALICLALSSPPSPELVQGGISLAGCRNCQDNQHMHLYECLHYLNQGPQVPCYTSQCIDNDMIYAKCDPTPANETDNCPMHVDATAPAWTQEIYVRDVYPGTCSDSGPGINDPLPAGSKPEDGPCQSPGIQFNVGKCFLTASCGANAVPGSKNTRQWGRLVCGA